MTPQGTPAIPRSLSDLRVDDLLAALAAPTPAPGGGAVSAFAGALGAALVGMITGLTSGRERYAGVRDEMTAMAQRAEALRNALSAGMDADTDAYGAVMAAYRLPKETAAEKAARDAQIQVALRRAAEVPLSVAEMCLETLSLASRAAALGNRNAISDAAVGALMAHAGLQGAVRNVRVNLQSIEDAAFCTAIEARAGDLVAAGEQALTAALAAADVRR